MNGHDELCRLYRAETKSTSIHKSFMPATATSQTQQINLDCRLILTYIYSILNDKTKLTRYFSKKTSKNIMMMMIMIPNESFSPESGGRVKARMAMEAIRMQGIIRLRKLKKKKHLV